MKHRIDINCDMGESYGHFKIGRDIEIMPHITSANIACGFHAGDPVTMARTVESAKRFKVEVGAHPGFPDLMGFGRREMTLSSEEIRNYIIYQIGALQAFAKRLSLSLQHVKPHGAMYDMASKNESISKAIVEAVQAVDSHLIVFAPPKSMLAKMAVKVGQRVALEVFADRAYNSDRTLVSRSRSNAVIEDPKLAVERVIKMITEGAVTAIDNKTVHLGEIHTICVHGDTPAAAELARKLKTGLRQAKIEVKPVRAFL